MTMDLILEMYSDTSMLPSLPRDADLCLFSDDNPPDTPHPIMAYSSKIDSNVVSIPGCTLMGWPTINIPRLDVWAREWTESRDLPFKDRDDVLYWVGGSLPYREDIVSSCRNIPGTYMKFFTGSHDFEPLVKQGHHKYMMDMQGIGWSARLMHLMWMGSVVFVLDRDLHEYWFREHFIPWVHYVPVAHDGSDLESVLMKVRSMPDGGEHIAVACRQRAKEILTERHAKDYFATVLRKHVLSNGIIQFC